MKHADTVEEIASHLEDIFWEAIAEGMSYEEAHDLVDDCVANTYIPGLVDEETDEVNESVLDQVYDKIPTEEDYAEYMEDSNSTE